MCVCVCSSLFLFLVVFSLSSADVFVFLAGGVICLALFTAALLVSDDYEMFNQS